MGDTASDFSLPRSSARAELFHQVLAERLLLAPTGTDRLSSVSGYVAPSALLSCLYQMDLKSIPTIKVQVVVGMAGAGTVTHADHIAYRNICEKFPDNVEIRYTPHGLAIHSKVYVWSSQESPRRAFLGSANFTRRGMGIGAEAQENTMCEIDATQASKYVKACWDESIDCLDPEVIELVPLINADGPHPGNCMNNDLEGREQDYADSRDFYLYSHKRMKPYKPSGGINWGISTDKRKRTRSNEAYLGVPTSTVDDQFFPLNNTPFLVRCDDGEILIMRLASGKSGKDISTLPHNDELGRYLRRRMNVPSGNLVGVEELLNYRRGHVTLTRVAETEYRLDFSQPSRASGIDSDLQKLADLNPLS